MKSAGVMSGSTDEEPLSINSPRPSSVHPLVKEAMVRALPKIPKRGHYTEQARQERLHFIREKTCAPLEAVSNILLAPEKLNANIEAMIGSVEIPVGAAGPLLIKGHHAKGLFYVPVATTEGALVSSITRGAHAISLAGGVTSLVIKQRMQRVPMFILADLHEARLFANWLSENFRRIRRVTTNYSDHADLKEIKVQQIGKVVHAHFMYETGDAAGQNMTTTCTWHACLWIVDHVKAELEIEAGDFVVEGGMASDKKVSYSNLINGRGIQVQAECTIPRNILRRVLKIDPETLQKFWLHSVTATIASGMVGLNTNIANLIAAVFAATGQDLACIHESSMAITTLEVNSKGDLYMSMMLPTLVVGTVGGGTHLRDQRDCLEMLGCLGPGKVEKFAEIIVGFCLSLDLSTMAAISAGHFAIAHEKLGRNRSINYFKLGELDCDFFTRMLRAHFADSTLQVIAVEPIDNLAPGDSVITEFASKNLKRCVGLFAFSLLLHTDSGTRIIRVMVKVKPTAAEVSDTISRVAKLCGEPLASELARCQDLIGSDTCDFKELAVLEQRDPRFVNNVPIVYGTFLSEQRAAFVLVEELLEGLELMNSAEDVSSWGEEHIKCALKGVSACHAIWYEKDIELKFKSWIGNYPTRERSLSKCQLYESLIGYAHEEFPDLFSTKIADTYRGLVATMHDWWRELEAMPRTLVHNDFSPRNIAFRRSGGEISLCCYDWELATIHVPQRDLVELLAFTLSASSTEEEIMEFVEYHRICLEQEIKKPICRQQWWEGFRYALYDFSLSTVLMYLMLHTFRQFEFLGRVVATVNMMLHMVETQQEPSYAQ